MLSKLCGFELSNSCTSSVHCSQAGPTSSYDIIHCASAMCPALAMMASTRKTLASCTDHVFLNFADGTRQGLDVPVTPG